MFVIFFSEKEKAFSPLKTPEFFRSILLLKMEEYLIPIFNLTLHFPTHSTLLLSKEFVFQHGLLNAFPHFPRPYAL